MNGMHFMVIGCILLILIIMIHDNIEEVKRLEAKEFPKRWH